MSQKNLKKDVLTSLTVIKFIKIYLPLCIFETMIKNMHFSVKSYVQSGTPEIGKNG